MYFPRFGVYKLRKGICVGGYKFLYTPVLQNLAHYRVEFQHLIEGLLICRVASFCTLFHFRVQLQFLIQQHPHLFGRGEVYSRFSRQFHSLCLNLGKFCRKGLAVLLQMGSVYFYAGMFHIGKHLHKRGLNLPIQFVLAGLLQLLFYFPFEQEHKGTPYTGVGAFFRGDAALLRLFNHGEEVGLCRGGEQVFLEQFSGGLLLCTGGSQLVNVYSQVTFYKGILLVAPLRVDDIVHQFNVVYLTLELYSLVPKQVVELFESVAGFGNCRVPKDFSQLRHSICCCGCVCCAASKNNAVVWSKYKCNFTLLCCNCCHFRCGNFLHLWNCCCRHPFFCRCLQWLCRWCA